MEHRWRVGPITIALHQHGGARRSTIARRTGAALLGQLARETTGIDLAIQRLCPTCGGTDHGRPVAADGTLSMSLAYAPGAVAVAVAPRGAVPALGVDVEAGAAEDVAVDGMSLQEWTRIEAAMKADGRAALLEPRTALIGANDIRFPDAAAWISTVLDAPEGLQVALAHRTA